MTDNLLFKIKLIGMIAILCLLAASTFAAIVMEPYLQSVTSNSVYVLVESNSTSTVTVNYGITPSYGTTATTENYAATTGSTYIHNIKLTGLSADTVYHYQAAQGSSNSANHVFRTAVNAGTNFRFVGMGDFRSQPNIFNQISGRVKDANPYFSLYMGDLCGDDTYNSFKSEFFVSNQIALIAGVPFFNTFGNHELWTQNSKAFTQAPTSADETRGYYSFDYADMHVLVLNYNISYTPGSAQYNFASNDLANTNKHWKVVIIHSPAYCSGGHGEDYYMKTLTTDIFEPNGVTMVLAGHTHFYQRNYVNGIYHLVLGSAGAPMHDLGVPPKSYVQAEAKKYHYAVFDVTATSIHMSVFDDQGVQFDSLDIGAPSNMGPQLIWRNYSTGDSLIWIMDGTTYSNYASLPKIADTQWKIKAAADFNADGKMDLLWRNVTTGEDVVWYMDGANYLDYSWLPQITDSKWDIAGAADFNGDSKPDVLWRNSSTGQNVIWFMNGTVYNDYSWLPQVTDTNWRIEGVADFNGDNKKDIVWRNGSNGQNVIWLMDGANYTDYGWLPTITDNNWKIEGAEDFDKNAKPDILWRNSSTGENIVWLMDGTNYRDYGWLPTIADTNWHIETVAP